MRLGLLSLILGTIDHRSAVPVLHGQLARQGRWILQALSRLRFPQVSDAV